MNPSEISVVVALLAGSLRALNIWRAATKVEVINVAVMSTLAQGRSGELKGLLHSVGPGAYQGVALAVTESFLQLLTEHRSGDPQTPLSVRDAREVLEREATRAVIAGVRRSTRDTGLDAVVLLGLVFAGVSAAVGDHASGPVALGLVATTLLWISNVWGARNNATRMYAGAMALADDLARGLDELRAAMQEPSPSEPRETER